MKRFTLELTKECQEAVDAARGDVTRNRFIESILWQNDLVRKAARKEKIKRVGRPAPGRPSSYEGEEG